MNDRTRGHGGGETSATRALTVIWIVSGGIVITLAALFFIWQRYQFVRLGIEVGALRQRHAVLSERLEPIKVEAEYLSRPERIERLARERLGMRVPRPDQVIVIDVPERRR